METDDFPPTLPEAFAEFRDALEWQEAESPRAARALAQRIKATVSRLVLFPQSGPHYIAGTRRLLLTPLPYELVYELDGGHVRIIAFAHTARKPGYWVDRLG